MPELEQVQVQALVPIRTIENGKSVKKALGSKFPIEESLALELSKKPKPPIRIVNRDLEETEPKPDPDQKEGELLDVNVKEARDIIANTTGTGLLNGWLEEEKAHDNRKTVLEAIEKRLSELAEGGE